MNESTPLRRPATASAQDTSDSSNNHPHTRNNNYCSSSQQSKNAARKRHVRRIATVGLLVAVVLYFGVRAHVATPANERARHANAVSTSSADSSGSAHSASSASLRSHDDNGPPPSMRASKLQPNAAMPADHHEQIQTHVDVDTVAKTDLLSQGAAHGQTSDDDDESDRVHFVPGFGAPLEKQVRPCVALRLTGLS